MEELIIEQHRSLAETPTYSVASVVTVMVFVCFLVERSIYRFGKWLKKTRRKALFASLEKIKEELMLLGLISLLLAQCARWISEICVDSSLFSSRFYLCSEKDYDINEHIRLESPFSSLNETMIPPKGITTPSSHQCGEGREPFVSFEGLEQLHRFLFVLGITHVLYSCVAVGLAMSKKRETRSCDVNQPLFFITHPIHGAGVRFLFGCSLLSSLVLVSAKHNKIFERVDHRTCGAQTAFGSFSFVHHYTSYILGSIFLLLIQRNLCFLRQFKSSIQKADYLALRLGFITKHKLPHTYNFHKYMVRSMEDEFNGILGISWPLWGYAIVCIFVNIHGLNIYFWLSFIPAILVMLVGTKLQHVVSSLALEIVEQTGPSVGTQLKPRDGLFWFGKPDILLRLIQFIIFQNAFEMATFIWSLWGLNQRSCFMENNLMIITRLASGVIVQFWCSYSTVPLNIIVTQMGSRCKKALVAESVRESLHSWCKRVKERSKRDSVHSHTTRSVCSLESNIDERDEITIASGTLSRSSSFESPNQLTVTSNLQPEEAALEAHVEEYSFRIEEYLSESVSITASQPPTNGQEGSLSNGEEQGVTTLFELFQNS